MIRLVNGTMIRLETTGLDLSADRGFVGLVDYGLFGERLPPAFSTVGLSHHIPNCLLSLTTEIDNRKLQKIVNSSSHDYIRYQSIRHVKVPRLLGIPHPQSYISQCLALKRHWEIVKKHCAKPINPVSRLFVRKLSGRHVFKMNYRGDDRAINQETDIRNNMGAQYVVKTDISGFFPSIYTHSIPWALHGRDNSKRDRKISTLPGNLLDQVTQGTRDRQTNGILIGPHASNVISEIILTKIDQQMIDEGFWKYSRYIDDYTFYAKDYIQAEEFLRKLGMQLREYELTLNERKTKILPLPLPIEEDWVRELNSFKWSIKGEVIRFDQVSSLLDHALNLAAGAEDNAVLNYAIKMVPARLNDRAQYLFAQRAVNLALLYPYLAPLLGEHVFDKHSYIGIEGVIRYFIEELLSIGVQRIQSDAIAHALYYSLRYEFRLSNLRDHLEEIIEIDDCISLVLLLEYARCNRELEIQDKIRERADKLKGMDQRERDRFGLLIYELWSDTDLKDEGQLFLAELKRKGFRFLKPLSAITIANKIPTRTLQLN